MTAVALNEAGRVVASTPVADVNHAMQLAHAWNTAETRPHMLEAAIEINGIKHNIPVQRNLFA